MSTGDDYFFKHFVAERKKIGLSQEEAAAQCGVGRQMWGKYERGETYPSSEVLLNFAKIGADVGRLFWHVQKINHANQVNQSYGEETTSLITQFESCDEPSKKVIRDLVTLLSQKNKE